MNSVNYKNRWRRLRTNSAIGHNNPIQRSAGSAVLNVPPLPFPRPLIGNVRRCAWNAVKLEAMIKSAEEFIRLRTSHNQEEYNRAANEAAPLQVWLEIIENHPEMRTWVAHNKTVPLEILNILSHDPDSEVRCRVAMKGKLPGHIQIALAKDKEYSVRHTIAHNAKATREALELLAEDEEESIGSKALERLEKGDHP